MCRGQRKESVCTNIRYVEPIQYVFCSDKVAYIEFVSIYVLRTPSYRQILTGHFDIHYMILIIRVVPLGRLDCFDQ